MSEQVTPPREGALALLCRHLRNKEMYYLAPGQAEDAFCSGICWCAKTQEDFGPDGLPATKADCGPGRSCHVS